MTCSRRPFVSLRSVIALLWLFAASGAIAGPNEGGTLILHANTSIVFTIDPVDYCGQSGLVSCADAVASLSGSEASVVFVLAAFPNTSSPRLAGLTFGVSYLPEVVLLDQGHCADFELATSDWPANGSGTAVTWTAARESTLTEVYWFAAYNYYAPAPAAFALVPHPTQGAFFADDGTPSVLDPIIGLGVLGFDEPGVVPCPDSQPTGACCLQDGTCVITFASECAGVGGVYQGDASLCIPDPCPDPSGACCFVDGTCQETSHSECDGLFGSWQGGDSCDPNPCTPPPVGACCFAGGVCVAMTAAQCSDAGGVYQGNFSLCDPNPCSTAAACCLQTGNCVLLPADECAAQGGQFQGDGTLCFPNPCPTPCSGPNIESGFHVSIPRPIEGVFGTERYDSFASDERRAGPNRSGTLILTTNPALEYTSGQNWCGTSGLAACEDGIVRHDGDTPAVLHVLAAFASESSPRLAGVTFGITYGNCFFLHEWGACGDFELPDATWPMPGTGTAVTWTAAQTSFLTEVYWFAGYTPLGATDVVRLVGHPTQGAYFADDGIPAKLDVIQDLGSIGFNIAGDLPCPVFLPYSGACCFQDGQCTVTDPPTCTSLGGSYFGDDVPCTPNPCPQPPGIGACCFANQVCTLTTAEDCTGSYMGEGTDCLPNPCPEPTGACCFLDGSCEVLTPSACAAAEGQYQGSGTNCDPNLCPVPPPSGACCDPARFCTVQTPANCEQGGGTYLGDGVLCVPNPCPDPCPAPARRPEPTTPRRPRPPVDPIALAHASGQSARSLSSGPNRHGTLIVSANPNLQYTIQEDWCGFSEAGACEEATTRVDEERTIVFHVLAAFAPESTPSLAGLTFGVEYGNCFVLDEWNACADFELSDDAWPASGSGTAVTWTEPHTSHLVEVYWFAGSSDVNHPEVFRLVPHPIQGAYFADDDVPANLDPIQALGALGFFTDGDLPCPILLPNVGGCCFEDGHCVVLDPDSCEAEGGTYFGDHSDCDPSPCPQPPAFGACCYGGLCVVTTAADCSTTYHGEYQGDNTSCNPDPCQVIPVRTSSWGRIKSLYR